MSNTTLETLRSEYNKAVACGCAQCEFGYNMKAFQYRRDLFLWNLEEKIKSDPISVILPPHLSSMALNFNLPLDNIALFIIDDTDHVEYNGHVEGQLKRLSLLHEVIYSNNVDNDLVNEYGQLLACFNDYLQYRECKFDTDKLLMATEWTYIKSPLDEYPNAYYQRRTYATSYGDRIIYLKTKYLKLRQDRGLIPDLLFKVKDNESTNDEVPLLTVIDTYTVHDADTKNTLATRLNPIDIRNRVDPNNPDSPLFRIIGNEYVVNILSWILSDALAHEDHLCSHNLAFIGPSSTGKTMISKIFAETLGNPFVEISPKAVKNAADIITAIVDVINKNNINVKVKLSRRNPEAPGIVVLPPMVIMLDDAHALSKAVIQSLLKATDHVDAILIGPEYKVDCSKLCWIMTTSDLGRMSENLVTRFQKLQLRLYTNNEIARIINRIHPEWDMAICLNIANYCNRIPREALNFAQLVKKAFNFSPTSLQNAIINVAESLNIDRYGMTYQRLNILKELGQRSLSVSSMCIIAECKKNELNRLVLPWLLASTNDQSPYVVESERRFYITRKGLSELDKRDIRHRGMSALCAGDRANNANQDDQR